MKITQNFSFYFLSFLGLILWQCSSPGNSGKDEPVSPKAKTFNTNRFPQQDTKQMVNITGRVKAMQELAVFSQVQGIAKATGKEFKVGALFKKGDILVAIDGEEFSSNLKAQKSSFLSSMVRVMSDLKVDYPNDYDNWQAYLNEVTIEKRLPELPKVTNEQLRYFLLGNNIYNQYHSLKAQEESLDKYRIRAPFDGVVTMSAFDPGSLITPGLKLGEYIRTDQYEIQSALSLVDFGDLEIGQQVTFRSKSLSKSWETSVSRISKTVDKHTQTVSVFFTISGNDLKEGMYLEAQLGAKTHLGITKIPRTLINRNNQIHVIEDGKVELKTVTLVDFNGNDALLRGIAPTDEVIVDPILSSIYGLKAVSK